MRSVEQLTTLNCACVPCGWYHVPEISLPFHLIDVEGSVPSLSPQFCPGESFELSFG